MIGSRKQLTSSSSVSVRVLRVAGCEPESVNDHYHTTANGNTRPKDIGTEIRSASATERSERAQK